MSAIRPASPRDTVHARLPDGRIFEAPPATPIGAILRVAEVHAGVDGHEAVAAVVDDRLRELTMPLVFGCRCGGGDAERHGWVAHLSALADAGAGDRGRRALPRRSGLRGALGADAGRVLLPRPRPAPFTPPTSRRLAFACAPRAADMPIHKTKVPVAQAVAIFEARGENDKARLLAHRQHDSLVLYELCGRQDYFQGYMLPSTGRLRGFALHPLGTGFVLQYPHMAKPGELARFEAYPKLFEAFAQAGAWLDTLGIRGTGALNNAITQGRLPEVSLVGEALHEARISRIAADIVARGDAIRVVLVAGPSSSGKTTFSKRLAVQLLASGRRPYPWRSTTTSWIARTRRLTSTANATSNRRGARRATHQRAPARADAGERWSCRGTSSSQARVSPGCRHSGPRDIVIVEGIHGLNPKLVPALPPDAVYRVYMSAITQLNLDGTTE